MATSGADLSEGTKQLLREEARDILERQTKLAKQLLKGSEAVEKLEHCNKSTAAMDSILESTRNNLAQTAKLLSQNKHHTQLLSQSFEKCLAAKSHAESIIVHFYS